MLLVSDPVTYIETAACLVVFGHATISNISRADIVKVRDQFNKWVTARAGIGAKGIARNAIVPAPAVKGKFVDASTASIGVIAGTDVLDAANIMGVAIESVAKGLDKTQAAVLRGALKEALAVLNSQTAEIKPDDDLFQGAVKRLAARKK